jgi:hypothetical protein
MTVSVLINREMGPGSHQCIKKPSIFLVCFQTSNFRENIAQEGFRIRILPESKFSSVTLQRTVVEGWIMVQYERLKVTEYLAETGLDGRKIVTWDRTGRDG